jgi:RuvB-like protein 1 (pontin 52)
LKLGKGVIDWLVTEGVKSSLRYGVCLAFKPVLIAFATRYALQLLTPASILVQLAGRSQIEMEDIGEMTELFLDAKTSVRNLAKGEF